MLIYGINPVLEALRAKRATLVRVSPRADDRLTAVVRLAQELGVAVQRVSVDELDRLAGGARHRHQGVIGDVEEAGSYSVEDLVIGAKAAPLLVVRQSRHAARLDGAAAKASAGAVAHVKIAEVVNIARAIDILKDSGVWTVGLDGDASKRYDEVDLTLPTAIVVGAEGTGLRRLVRERCDWLVSIPMGGHVQSLNVSVATGIALFEAVRQRTRK